MYLLIAMDSLAQPMNSRNTPLFAVRLLTSVTPLNFAQVILLNAQEMTLPQLELNAEPLLVYVTCHLSVSPLCAHQTLSKIPQLFAEQQQDLVTLKRHALALMPTAPETISFNPLSCADQLSEMRMMAPPAMLLITAMVTLPTAHMMKSCLLALLADLFKVFVMLKRFVVAKILAQLMLSSPQQPCAVARELVVMELHVTPQNTALETVLIAQPMNS
jgi:hypothetical protein